MPSKERTETREQARHLAEEIKRRCYGSTNDTSKPYWWGCTVAGHTELLVKAHKLLLELADAGRASQPPNIEMAQMLGIHFYPELDKEGAGWEVPMEPGPEYFETFPQAVGALFNMLNRECVRLEKLALGRASQSTPEADFSIDRDQQCRKRVITDMKGGWLHCQKAKEHSGQCDPNGYEVTSAGTPTPDAEECSECGVRRDNHRYHRFRENGYAKCSFCGTQWNGQIETCPKCGDVPKFTDVIPVGTPKGEDEA